MAVNPLKIRLGACDTMVLFGNTTNAVDLGGSVGGAELNYNPTTFQVEVDQLILPAAAFKTKEEVEFTAALVQSQMNLAAIAFGYGSSTSSNVTTTLAGTLAAAPSFTVTPQGTTGATSYSYQLVPFDSNGDDIPPTAVTTATGNATLTATNFNQVAWTSIAGAVGYRIIRSASGGTPSSTGLIGTVWWFGAGTALTFNDTGLAATAYTASPANPATPNYDQMFFGGQVFIPTGAFDFSIPKNDGSLLHLRGHLNKVYSAKAIKLNASRDKHTEMSKLSLIALADTTQALGKQAGYLIEEY